MQKLLIYTPKISPRVQYIFDFILTEFSGISFELTTNIQFFQASDSLKISYSPNPISDEIHWVSDDLMFENSISEKVVFDELNPIGKLFFALSRYEEYLPQIKDSHQRILGKTKVYKTPFVDKSILELQQVLLQKNPHLQFKKRNFQTILTCDVDQTWKYKNKGFLRTYGGVFKDFLQLNFEEIKRRNQVLSGKIADPYDQFEYFKSLKEKHSFEMIFFWLLGKRGKFDKNISVKNQAQMRKIKEVSTWAKIGIHPSYASNFSKNQLSQEIKTLENILEQKITKSRQHYIKLDLPKTYQNLIENEIEQDYTMYFADETGFRAGTCTPFYWFDLTENKKTNLQIQPFCAMDVTLRNYMKLNLEEAIQELKRLKTEVKKVKGQFLILFHNSNLADDWAEWKSVLEATLQER